MSATLKMVSEDDPMEALRAEAKRLRDALKDSERQREFVENTLQNMTRHIVALHEQFGERLTMMSLGHEARCQKIERRIAEVGDVADRCAQALTVRNLRSPEDNESTADTIEAHRAWES